MRLNPGSGCFNLSIPKGHAVDEIPIWYHLPRGLAADSKIVIVLHGTSRAAQASRDNWSGPAEQGQFLVVVPHFEKQHFSDASYAYGNFWTPDPPYQPLGWEMTYGVILDRLFDAVKSALGWSKSEFTLYGHSAGAAFAHRYMALAPEDKVEQAIIANAGWYSLLNPGMPIPLGFGRCDLSLTRIKRLLEKDITILIGDEDRFGPYLDWWPNCHLEQGPHRLARSQTYFKMAADLADRLAVPFNWRWESVPGVAHENAKMIGPAARILAQNKHFTR